MNDWVYSRIALAEYYLNSLDIGVVNRLALFSPRRRGKTLFLIHDLIPLAEQNDYFPVYASLWDNLDHPQIPLLQSLREAVSLVKKRGKLTTLLATPIKKLTVGNSVIKADIEFAQNPSAPTGNELAEISSLITEIAQAKKKKSLLLLVDEVQHISTHDAFKPIAFTLRTAADKNLGKVKIIFTGSSRTGMRELFDKNNAAFYNSVERLDFPVLDDNFIEFCRTKLKKDFRISTDFESMKAAFVSLDFSPYWFISVLFKMILHKIELMEALDVVRDEITEIEGYASLYNKLKPLDRIVLMALTTNSHDIFSEATAKEYSKILSEPIKVTTIQYTVNKLIKLQLVTKLGRSDYVVERPGLGQYIREKSAEIAVGSLGK